MTQAAITKTSNDVEIAITGHAGYNPGNDVVCAGISTLSYTLINYLNYLAEAAKIKELHVEADEGNHRIRFEKYTAYDPIVDSAIEMFIMGLKMVSEHYPNNLQVTAPKSVQDQYNGMVS